MAVKKMKIVENRVRREKAGDGKRVLNVDRTNYKQIMTYFTTIVIGLGSTFTSSSFARVAFYGIDVGRVCSGRTSARRTRRRTL